MIRIDETWDEFRNACVYKFCCMDTAEKDKCLHSGASVALCLEKKYCPRIAKAKKVEVAPWRTSFEEYLKEAERGRNTVTLDAKWINKMRGLYPDADITATIDKAFKTYWAEEIGWINKKKRKGATIDWYKTYEYPIKHPNYAIKKKGRYEL